MDSLVEMPRERWPAIRDKFLDRWEYSFPGYYSLDTQLSRPDLAARIHFHLYCPGGDADHGVVAMNDKGSLKEIIILPVDEGMIKLREALLDTKRIDWSQTLCVPYAPDDVREMMQGIVEQLQTKLMFGVPTRLHRYPKTMKPYDNLTCPEGTYVAPLKIENVEQVDRAWPHRYPTSPELFKMLIELDLSLGLYSSTDNSLLCWLFLCEAGFITHLYTEESSRKRGLAEFLVKHLVNEQLSKDKDVLCYILVENVASLKLFEKLGFEMLDVRTWIFLGKGSKMSSNL